MSKETSPDASWMDDEIQRWGCHMLGMMMTDMPPMPEIPEVARAQALMSRAEISTWNDPDSIHAYEPYREITRPASRKVVERVLRQYSAGKSPILEVGSGLGELVRLVPAYRDRIQQTDGNLLMVDAHKERDSESNIVQADVYHLPFKDRSYSRVVGYSSLDTVADLPRAVSEIHRVLKKKGRVIHFLDMVVSAHPVFQLSENEAVIPFPYLDEIKMQTALRFVSHDAYEQRRSRLGPELRIFLDTYARSPEAEYVLLSQDFGRLCEVSSVAERLFPDAPTKELNQFFFDRMRQALQSSQFAIEVFEPWDAGATIEQPPGWANNVYINNVGHWTVEHSSAVEHIFGAEKAEATSVLHVIVARKM